MIHYSLLIYDLQIIMKKAIIPFLVTLALTACNPNPEYQKSASNVVPNGKPVVSEKTKANISNNQETNITEKKDNSNSDIPMTMEQIKEIGFKIDSLTDKSETAIFNILKDVPISNEVEVAYQEFLNKHNEEVKAGLKQKATDIQLNIVKALLALSKYEESHVAIHLKEKEMANIYNDSIAIAEEKVNTFLYFPFKGIYGKAETKAEKEVLKKVTDKIKEVQKEKNLPEPKINVIKEMPIKGLFVFYTNDNPVPMVTNKNADYFIVLTPDPKRLKLNNVLDSKTNDVFLNSEINQNIYKDLVKYIKPTIKHVWGKGERAIYVFSDPDCPYCREQDNEFKSQFTEEDNVTVYQIMNPLKELHPFAYPKAAHLLCMPNPSEEWTYMQENNGEARKFNKDGYNEKDYTSRKIGECLEEVSLNKGLADIIGLKNTPTIITDNGVVLINKRSIQEIRDALNGKIPDDMVVNINANKVNH